MLLRLDKMGQYLATISTFCYHDFLVILPNATKVLTKLDKMTPWERSRTSSLEINKYGRGFQFVKFYFVAGCLDSGGTLIYYQACTASLLLLSGIFFSLGFKITIRPYSKFLAILRKHDLSARIPHFPQREGIAKNHEFEHWNNWTLKLVAISCFLKPTISNS